MAKSVQNFGSRSKHQNRKCAKTHVTCWYTAGTLGYKVGVLSLADSVFCSLERDEGFAFYFCDSK